MRIGLSFDLKPDKPPVSVFIDDSMEEYDSMETVELIKTSLKANGHDVVSLGGGSSFLDKIRSERVDFVFNIAEGQGNYRSRESQVPCILEMLDIPYSGSDPLCLAICLDKALTKKMVATEGVITPKWKLISGIEEIHDTDWKIFSFPLMIKPAHEGSSKGVRLTSVVMNMKELEAEANRLFEGYNQSVMVEEFISGDEITVGMTGNSPTEVLGIMRVLPRNRVEHFVYSLEVKRDYLKLIDYECPPKLDTGIIKRLEEASLKIFNILGCRDFARLDFRLGNNDTPYFIEINPLPGLGSHSDLVIMAKMLGIYHPELVNKVLTAAVKRYALCPQVSQ
ncbi:MAG: ATP-grasp domain-containing protein [Dehalococcoidales bacterium]|nr:ATP-grasp domain-containing protein [Dehalococcoidales bacterium]